MSSHIKKFCTSGRAVEERQRQVTRLVQAREAAANREREQARRWAATKAGRPLTTKPPVVVPSRIKRIVDVRQKAKDWERLKVHKLRAQAKHSSEVSGFIQRKVLDKRQAQVNHLVKTREAAAKMERRCARGRPTPQAPPTTTPKSDLSPYHSKRNVSAEFTSGDEGFWTLPSQAVSDAVPKCIPDNSSWAKIAVSSWGLSCDDLPQDVSVGKSWCITGTVENEFRDDILTQD